MPDSIPITCDPTLVSPIHAIRWTPEAGARSVVCPIAKEIPLTIRVNGNLVSTLLASPDSLRELTIGHLLARGDIHHPNQILTWQVDYRTWCASITIQNSAGSNYPPPGLPSPANHLAITPTPSIADHPSNPHNPSDPTDLIASTHPDHSNTPASELQITPQIVVSASRWITECSTVFRETGGFHTAGLYDPLHGPLFFFEDIARHNAVDKTIGKAFSETLKMNRLILVCTGRTSSESIRKAHRAGLTILIARSAPTHPAVILAQDTGITLVGFARNDGFTIYTHAQRILI
ncbi:formate dehydrogenase accessory sulfurtransferase FdhD [bacterium]|nr:formate dehydrogenase accessory sulfurtransferase FdhD [candidate division CSSED10-310 bacterium]